MRKSLLFSLLATLACAASGRAAENWADAKDGVSGDPAYRNSKAVCDAARTVPLPAPPAGPAAPANCSSEALYYGIGRPADPAAAHRCAVAEQGKDPDNQEPFAGTAMRMTMFANGVGARRDLDAAIALACLLPGAAAEMDGRVLHLAALRKDGPGPEPFGYCDDITSGLGQGQCAAHDSAVAAASRASALAALSDTLPPAVRPLLDRAGAAMKAFADARADNEVDVTGTARAAFQIEAADEVRDAHLTMLKAASAAAAVRPSGVGALATEDKALNDAYRAVMAVKDPQWGTPTKAGIQATERCWLTYRDAVRALVSAAWGDSAAGVAVATLTHRRAHDLREFLG